MVVIEPSATELSGSRPALGSALIDTGANGTSLDRQTALDCGFKQVDMGVHITADGKKSLKPIYRGTVKITGLSGYSKTIDMIECDVRDSQGVIALIGTDILKDGSLEYDGTKGVFTLELP